MDLFAAAESSFFNIYKRFPIDVDKGRGVYLYDKNGHRYLDFLSGIAVNALGYHHPEITEAILTQLDRNLHLSNYFVQDIQVEFAETLLKNAPGFNKLFLTNSGTEAIEGLLKLVKKWSAVNNKNEIIAFEGSFHGRSLGALSLTMQPKYQDAFKPLLPNIVSVPFNNVAAFKAAVNEKTAAIFYEGITGEGGVRPVSEEMFCAFQEARDTFGCLLIADEIQSGVGRTGSFYYFQQTDCMPDGFATAKGVGGGLPLGAFVVGPKLQDGFKRGDHGTTYGGNPLACAAGLAAIRKIGKKTFLENVKNTGTYFRKQLRELQNIYPGQIVEVRGHGLMIGVQVTERAVDLMDHASENGLIFNIAGGTTLRFVPPLIVTKSHIDEAMRILQETFSQVFT